MPRRVGKGKMKGLSIQLSGNTRSSKGRASHFHHKHEGERHHQCPKTFEAAQNFVHTILWSSSFTSSFVVAQSSE